MSGSDQFQVSIHWRAARDLVAGRTYLLLRDEKEIAVTITALKYIVDQVSGEQLPAAQIKQNEHCVANIATEEGLFFNNIMDRSFSLLDPKNKNLLGVGKLEFELRRATNIRWQPMKIDKQARAQAKRQKPCCIWFTGLSGSGKSTLANLVEQQLFSLGLHTYSLDGDNLRHGLNRDLGFTEANRVENIRRVAEVARLMVDAGLIVLASFIPPYSAERDMARQLFNADEFFEVFVDTPLIECEKRDVKGLYAKARRGELKNFTGIDSVYERPKHPDLVVDGSVETPEAMVKKIIQLLALT
jgi:adenylyl-sulfate kinase